MTRSVKNAEGSSLRCIDDNASFARALSSVNTDFHNFEAASPYLFIRRGQSVEQYLHDVLCGCCTCTTL